MIRELVLRLLPAAIQRHQLPRWQSIVVVDGIDVNAQRLRESDGMRVGASTAPVGTPMAKRETESPAIDIGRRSYPRRACDIRPFALVLPLGGGGS